MRLAAQTSKEKHGDFRDARVYQSKVRDAANAMRGIGRDQAHVAEVRARENRELAERIMKDAIEKLGQQGEEGRAAAATVARFLATMPPPVTELEAIQREIAQNGISREPMFPEGRDPRDATKAAQRGGR